MAAKLQLNNFRFSIYIDADGTVTLTDLPPELRDVAKTLDPSLEWEALCPVVPPLGEAPAPESPAQAEHPSAAAEVDQPVHARPHEARESRRLP